MARLRRSCWWEPLLPAGLWLAAADLTLRAARAQRRLGFRSPHAMLTIVRLSARLSRAGFNSWRFWRRKWR